MYGIGIDVGSTFTKYCVLDEQGQILNLKRKKTPIRQKEYFVERITELKQEFAPAKIVTCGYGRGNVAAERNVSELTALAVGADHVCPGAKYILDIGGQDSKLICQENGRLKGFFLNEKCAAGCGIFLGNVLNLLQVDFGDVDLTAHVEREMREIKLSSVCAVFAQSEIVELLAAGTDEKSIIRAVVTHVLGQANALLNKMDCDRLLLSGGFTDIPGIAALAEKIWQKPVYTLPEGAYLSAIGCAVLAGRK